MTHLGARSDCLHSGCSRRWIARSAIALGFVALLFAITTSCSTSPPAAARPDRKIAYAHKGALYVVSSTGADGQRLVEDAVYDRPLTWSPDGGTLLYWKHSDIGWDIWAVDPVDLSTRNLTNVESGGCRSPSWSPDGSHIAFMRDEPAGLYVMGADGSEARRLSELGHRDDTPAWSPDGTRLAFSDYASRSQGKARTGLAIYDVSREVCTVLGLSGSGDTPSWLSDSRTLIYSGRSQGRSEIYTHNVQTGEVRALTATEANDIYPVLSPDRSRVAFISGDSDSRTLNVMNIDGSQQRVLQNFKGNPWLPSWSPDGRKIVLGVLAKNGVSRVMVISTESGDSAVVAEGSFPVWQP